MRFAQTSPPSAPDRALPPHARACQPRLTPAERRAIETTAAQLLPPGSRVLLFGSRTDPARRGGDIDLCLHVPVRLSASERLDLANRFWARLVAHLDEQKIDLVIVTPETPPSPLLRRIAEEGIELCRL
ncbi:nucleotidyltransferase domain-containing protein [Hydrogenophilus thiooxidans]|uniref:nucleotidyltransferase domain-containing protein n=1 Tax=Hydrogenophilus thiooxidans TaxID=2820326 RepID=UPI001C223E13|nr:nucleotidyltransferase domain-containing protein [Hydrogenophilus thiooxidans]